MKSLDATTRARKAAALMLMAASLGAPFCPSTAFADAEHAAKPAAAMPGMDHGTSGGAMDTGDRDHAHGGAHWMAPPDAAARKNPVRADKASRARGKKLYAANCASCHGASGKGDGPAGASLTPRPSDLATMAPQHPPGDLAWKIENGRGAMPAWKGTLSQTEIWDVVNYLQSFTPTRSKAKADANHAGHAH